MEDYELALQILEMCNSNVEAPTVDEIVSETGADTHCVVRVLDQYRVTDGVPKDMGPGGGGNWMGDEDNG